MNKDFIDSYNRLKAITSSEDGKVFFDKLSKICGKDIDDPYIKQWISKMDDMSNLIQYVIDKAANC